VGDRRDSLVLESAENTIVDGSDEPPPTPRWVYVLAVIGAIFAALFVGLHLSGRGLGGH